LTENHEGSDPPGGLLQHRPILERPKFDIRIMKNNHEAIWTKLMDRLTEKGWGIYISSHETLGIITEEYTELIEAVGENDHAHQWKELLDIAVAALAGMASIDSGEMQW